MLIVTRKLIYLSKYRSDAEVAYRVDDKFREFDLKLKVMNIGNLIVILKH